MKILICNLCNGLACIIITITSYIKASAGFYFDIITGKKHIIFLSRFNSLHYRFYIVKCLVYAIV